MYVNETLYIKKTNEFMSNSNTFKLFVTEFAKVASCLHPFSTSSRSKPGVCIGVGQSNYGGQVSDPGESEWEVKAWKT